MTQSLEPTEIPPNPPPRPSLLPKSATVAQAIGGVPGTVIALATALTAAIQAYTGYQDSQAVQKSAYEAIKVATDRNTEQLNRVQAELAAGRKWMEGIERIVQDLQRQAGEHVPHRTAAPPVTPPLIAPPLPSFEQIKKD